MEFETLSKNHANKLLDFELKNKQWFETLIEPRANDFYSIEGVVNHIDDIVTQMNNGKAYSAVVTKGNVIIARANIKDVRNKSAYVGYRVAKDFTSQGVASYCLSQLITIAQDKLDIKQLKAKVLDNNPASTRVLNKLGFIALNTVANYSTFNGQQFGCTEFGLKYA